MPSRFRRATTLDLAPVHPRKSVDRVAEREKSGEEDSADAAFHAQVVLDVVEEAVTEGALEDVRQQLPEDEGYGALFELAEAEESPG